MKAFTKSQRTDVYCDVAMTRCSPVWIVKKTLLRYLLQEKVSYEERIPKVKMSSHTHARFGLDMVSEPRAGFEFYN